MPEIQAATYSECGCCGSREQVTGSMYGCDMCQRHIPWDSESRCEIVVFRDNDASAEHYIFDKLVCAYAWLAQYQPPKDFRFLTLPYLSGREAVTWFIGRLKADEGGCAAITTGAATTRTA